MHPSVVGAVGVWLAHVGEVPRPSWPGVLTAWELSPLVWVPILLAAGLYEWGFARVRRYPGVRRIHFHLGLLVLALALVSPLGAYDDTIFWVHMLQHLLITAVAAPLLALGAPVALALRALPAGPRRRVAVVVGSRVLHRLTSPVLTWLYLAVWLYVVHFSPLYEAALTNDWIHAAEHLVFLVAGFLFWWPVVGLDPGARRLAWPVRLLYLLVFTPVGVFLGLAIYSAGAPLYPHYAHIAHAWGSDAMADQRLAGEMMWEGGMLLNLAALPFVIFGWFRHEQREAERTDRRLDREAAAKP